MAISNFILTVGGCWVLHRPRPATHRCRRLPPRPTMSLIFMCSAVGVGAVALLMSKDLRHSSAMLRRNVRHIRTWLEEQGAAAE